MSSCDAPKQPTHRNRRPAIPLRWKASTPAQAKKTLNGRAEPTRPGTQKVPGAEAPETTKNAVSVSKYWSYEREAISMPDKSRWLRRFWICGENMCMTAPSFCAGQVDQLPLTFYLLEILSYTTSGKAVNNYFI
jgi:hypothetical protein